MHPPLRVKDSFDTLKNTNWIVIRCPYCGRIIQVRKE